MNKSRLSALALALALSAVSAFSCSEKASSGDNPNTSVADTTDPANKYSGNSKKTNSAFGQEMEVNNTVFTLNVENSDFVFINVTIKNKTDIEYEINSMNNFFVALPDETEISMDIRANLYAIQNYPKCIQDNITIPANGEFTGFLAGGFLVPAGTDSLTVGFFPTLNNEKDASNVILSPVNAENISTDDSILK